MHAGLQFEALVLFIELKKAMLLKGLLQAGGLGTPTLLGPLGAELADGQGLLDVVLVADQLGDGGHAQLEALVRGPSAGQGALELLQVPQNRLALVATEAEDHVAPIGRQERHIGVPLEPPQLGVDLYLATGQEGAVAQAEALDGHGHPRVGPGLDLQQALGPLPSLVVG